MTKDKALKLALEALESGVNTQSGRIAWTEYDSWLINAAITAIKEALAPTSTQCEVQPEQEPFGHWHWEQPMTKPLQGWFVKGPSDGKLTGVAGIALYTAPLLPEQEPVAKYIGECNDGSLVQLYEDVTKGTVFYTTLPQRPWVKLTDADWEPLYDKFAKHQEYGAFVSGWDNFARAVEAKLKEKNNG